MPIFEYKCEACGNTFEVIHSVRDRKFHAVCAICGGSKDVKKQISAPNIHFKGAGFYCNDYGNKTGIS